MKTVLITGAARGIGRAIAQELAAQRYNIIINYNSSQDEAKALEQELSLVTGVLAVQADVSKPEEIEHMIVASTQRFGSIDYLVNNAGIAWTGLFTEMKNCQCDALVDINLMGTIYTTKAVLPDMISRKRGKIVNISSIWGKKGASCEVVYSATKSAIIGFTEALAQEVALSGICVNCICPGVIDTDMLSNLSQTEKEQLAADTPLHRLGSPSDVAKAVAFLLSDDAAFITGQTLTVDGGFL